MLNPPLRRRRGHLEPVLIDVVREDLDTLTTIRQGATVAARLLDDIAGCVRENLVQRAQFTVEVAEQFERLAQVTSCLAAVGSGQPVPAILKE